MGLYQGRCFYCGHNIIKIFHRGGKVFCSQSCSTTYFVRLKPKLRILKTCKNCKGAFVCFINIEKIRKFCSPSCASKYNNRKRKGYRDVEVNCAYCDKEFSLILCEFNKRKGNIFCSRQHASKFFKGTKRPKTSKSLIKAYKNGLLIANLSRYAKDGFREDIGIYVRSTWEANFARILNYLDIKWEYEPKAFSLIIDGKETTYHPDFYLIDFDKWVEVKGYWRKDAKLKYDKFSENHNISLVDTDKYKKLAKRLQDKIIWEGKRYEQL